MKRKNRINEKNNTKLKILFFHNTLPEYRIGWFREMSQKADMEFVITNEKMNKRNYGYDIDNEWIKGISFTFLSNGVNGFNELKKIIRVIHKYDFVELPPLDSFREVVYSAYIVRKCRKSGVKIGYFWEKWEAPKDKQPTKRKIKNLILRIIPKSIYKYSDIIFATGQKSRQYFVSNGIPKEKIIVIPDTSETPAYKFEDIRVKYRIPKEKRIIMFMGRIMPEKGVRYLIEAYGSLSDDIRNNTYLLVAGDGKELPRCRELVETLHLENVIFVGKVPPLTRGNYFSQCNIFVYPVTYYDGWVDVWGLTLNEAVQHGKIIIATDAVGSAYELIEDGVNGYRVSPENLKELSWALETSLLDYELPYRARQKDKDLMKKFSFCKMTDDYLQGVQRALSV